MKPYLEHYASVVKSQGRAISYIDKQITKEVFSIHHHFTQHDLAQHSKLKVLTSQQLREGLEHLIDAGMIRKIYSFRDRITYEHIYGHAHHDHLICLECGMIQEFRDEKIETQQQVIAECHHFNLVRHSMNLYGLCHTCQEKLPEDYQEIESEIIDIKQHEDVPLSLISDGSLVKVMRLEGGHQLIQRLNEMGLVPGSTIKIITNRFEGQMVVKVKNSRLALGHHLTHKIIVQQIG